MRAGGSHAPVVKNSSSASGSVDRRAGSLRRHVRRLTAHKAPAQWFRSPAMTGTTEPEPVAVHVQHLQHRLQPAAPQIHRGLQGRHGQRPTRLSEDREGLAYLSLRREGGLGEVPPDRLVLLPRKPASLRLWARRSAKTVAGSGGARSTPRRVGTCSMSCGNTYASVQLEAGESIVSLSRGSDTPHRRSPSTTTLISCPALDIAARTPWTHGWSEINYGFSPRTPQQPS